MSHPPVRITTFEGPEGVNHSGPGRPALEERWSTCRSYGLAWPAARSAAVTAAATAGSSSPERPTRASEPEGCAASSAAMTLTLVLGGAASTTHAIGATETRASTSSLGREPRGHALPAARSGQSPASVSAEPAGGMRSPSGSAVWPKVALSRTPPRATAPSMPTESAATATRISSACAPFRLWRSYRSRLATASNGPTSAAVATGEPSWETAACQLTGSFGKNRLGQSLPACTWITSAAMRRASTSSTLSRSPRLRTSGAAGRVGGRGRLHKAGG